MKFRLHKARRGFYYSQKINNKLYMSKDFAKLADLLKALKEKQ